MTQETTPTSRNEWTGTQAYVLAVVSLVLGLAIGYFLRGSQSPSQTAASPAVETSASAQQTAPTPDPAQEKAAMLEQMKAMAEKASAPAKEKLKTNPKDVKALNDAGNVYRATHQFKEAAEYYQKALEIDPKNPAIRTDLASCLYFTGDVDGALAQLDKALSYDPAFFGALLNSGLIKLRAKKDTEGAIASWQKILSTKANPKQKEMIRQLIANAKENGAKPSEDPKS